MKLRDGKDLSTWNSDNDIKDAELIKDIAIRWADLMEEELLVGRRFSSIVEKTYRRAKGDKVVTGAMHGKIVIFLMDYWVYARDLKAWMYT